MKRGAFLLNVARGGILDEAAVADGLRSGLLGGAGIDVFENEPPVGSPLLDAPNTVLTPHLGASTAEAQVLVSEEVATQLLDVLEGRSARYAVNAPLLTPETAQAVAPYLPLAEILGRFFSQFSRTASAGSPSRSAVSCDWPAGCLSADRGDAPRAARGFDHRAGQPGQCGGPGQGPRDRDRRAQVARRRGLRGAAQL